MHSYEYMRPGATPSIRHERARWGTGRLDAFHAWLWLSCWGGSAAVQEGEERVVVGGLDGWYGVQADAFVGAVHALVVHAESCGGGMPSPAR